MNSVGLSLGLRDGKPRSSESHVRGQVKRQKDCFFPLLKNETWVGSSKIALAAWLDSVCKIAEWESSITSHVMLVVFCSSSLFGCLFQDILFSIDMDVTWEHKTDFAGIDIAISVWRTCETGGAFDTGLGGHCCILSLLQWSQQLERLSQISVTKELGTTRANECWGL
eukprot:scaffold23543_cov19-Prasinocladus_malaysianus.AAC.1